jgi:hypothetical protein
MAYKWDKNLNIEKMKLSDMIAASKSPSDFLNKIGIDDDRKIPPRPKYDYPLIPPVEPPINYTPFTPSGEAGGIDSKYIGMAFVDRGNWPVLTSFGLCYKMISLGESKDEK